MTHTSPLLSVEELAAGYRTPLVDPISFQVYPGEVVGLRGQNGCGKSATLQAIGGSARLFAGRIVRRHGLRIAHQYQNSLPLEDVPLCGCEPLVLPAGRSRGLPDWSNPLLHRWLGQLSGGQLQFLQSWACLKAPEDLVRLDEPTNNVDRQGIAFLRQLFVARQRLPAVLLIHHEHELLTAVCDRIMEVAK